MIIFTKYLISGGSAVVLHFFVMITLVEVFGANPFLASLLGFLTGSLLNYTIQYHWTFRSGVNHTQAFTRYTAVTGVMLLINMALFQFSVDVVGFDYRISQLISTCIVFFANFTTNARFTFK